MQVKASSASASQISCDECFYRWPPNQKSRGEHLCSQMVISPAWAAIGKFSLKKIQFSGSLKFLPFLITFMCCKFSCFSCPCEHTNKNHKSLSSLKVNTCKEVYFNNGPLPLLHDSSRKTTFWNFIKFDQAS